MLKRLTIDNFALINHIDVDFDDGLSIITGETGAGKSIIMGALSLLLGAKADSRSVKDRNLKLVVEAVFDVRGYDLSSFFKSHEIDCYPEETIVRREILPSGRSRSFINDVPVQLSVLSELTEPLIDIHSQHSNALLLKPSYQLSMLDVLAGNKNILAEYKETYKHLVDCRREYDDAFKRIERNKADEEYFRFQLNQLESANLRTGEQEELEKEKSVLENLAQLKDNMSGVCSALTDGASSTIDTLSDAIRCMGLIESVYDGAPGILERLESAKIDLQDISDTVRHDFQNLDGGASDLDEIEGRLSTIYSLQQKFRLDTVEDLLDLQSSLKHSLEEIDNSEDELEDLRRRMQKARVAVEDLAKQLSMTRRKASYDFMRLLSEKAKTLGLVNFKGEVCFETIEPGMTGQDKVQIKVSFNKNQELVPIEKTASGGELSRLMLCVKTILAEKMQLPTIIFDEVDTGVSGDVANKIGEMMAMISKKIQVFAITHLPQVAALGKQHYKVFKTDSDVETTTSIKKLDRNEQIMEVARMLSGATVDAAAIANAESLIGKNRK